MKLYYETADKRIRIYHGDSEILLPQLEKGGLIVDTVVSDPPYGIDFDTDYTKLHGGKTEKGRNSHPKIKADNKPFNPSRLLGYRSVILWGANCYSDKLPLGALLIWDKRTPVGNKGVFSDGEVAWFNHGHGVYIFSHTWNGFNRASERQTAFHPTQKPVELALWCLGKAKPQGMVCDPYMGAGWVLVACQRLGLACVGFELEERYCEIAANRLRQMVLF